MWYFKSKNCAIKQWGGLGGFMKNIFHFGEGGHKMEKKSNKEIDENISDPISLEVPDWIPLSYISIELLLSNK